MKTLTFDNLKLSCSKTNFATDDDAKIVCADFVKRVFDLEVLPDSATLKLVFRNQPFNQSHRITIQRSEHNNRFVITELRYIDSVGTYRDSKIIWYALGHRLVNAFYNNWPLEQSHTFYFYLELRTKNVVHIL